MAVLPVLYPTMMDVVNATDPNGGIAAVAEILHQTNEILMDMVVVESNLATGHQTTIRTGLPSGTWRKMYKGVQPTKATRAKITDTIGMLEAYAEIDKEEADLNGNTAAFRLDEDSAHIEGLNQQMALTLFTGDETINPERFTGFNARYNDLSAENADNIIDAGGTGSDNATIWLIGWGSKTCHGIYPKGSKAGLTAEDLGEETLTDAAGGLYQGYRSHYIWKNGLTLRDWRYVVRICNIDKSALTSDASSGANIPELAFQAMELIPNLSMARFAYYCSREIRTKWRQQAALLTNQSTLVTENVGGIVITSSNSIPIRKVDALAADEARVV